MTFFAWLLFIVLLGAIGLWLKRDWETRRLAEQAAQAAAENADGSTPVVVNPAAVKFSSITTFLTPLRERVAYLTSPKPPVMGAKFRAWMMEALGKEPELRAWLASLSDEQLDALAVHINVFAHEMGFELTWLLNQEVAQQPALTQALTRIVVDYCRACRQSVNLQDELEVYKAIRQYVEAPHSQPNRVLGEALFGKLLERGLTSIKIADYLALSPQERYQQVVTTVQQAAVEKPELFQKLVKEVVIARNGHHVQVVEAAPAAMNGATPHA